MIDDKTTLPEATAPPISEEHTQATEEIGPRTLELLEVPATLERPIMTTPFSEYTVTEGLLLLIVLLLIVKGAISLVKEVL